ncbi:MAG TPA: bis(5'-nucleosyl)-tetraphosphatase (symmetrical) YqeK [Mobilitalea sp.]|nr:bis(5'-nucleosyl)-tetraphosphatase (symmetrical) YqeK [Mobilitalea sp.]
MMDLELIRKNLKGVLSQSRFLHSIGVEEVACDMAVIFSYDMEKAGFAGLLHDCAKYLSDQQLLVKCEEYHLPVSETERKCPFLLHGKVGAAFAQKIYGVEDEEILTSIVYHTTGRPAMSVLEKIIFIADYIEPYRKPIPRIDEIRSAAYLDLDLAVVMTAENTLKYLKNSGSVIDTLTIETYEYYKTVIRDSQVMKGDYNGRFKENG